MLQIDTKELTYLDPTDNVRKGVTHHRDYLLRTPEGEQERNYPV